MSGPDLPAVGVWDVNEPRWWDHHQARSGWLTGHDLPAHKMCRVEFYLLDGPVARIFGYACEQPGPGCPPGCLSSRVVLADVLLSEFPPQELL